MNRNLATYDGWSYTYNSMNRLTSATTTGTSAYFYYDGLNRQVAPYVSSNPVTFSVWDGWNFYAEYSPGNVLSDTLTYRRVATWLSMARAPL